MGASGCMCVRVCVCVRTRVHVWVFVRVCSKPSSSQSEETTPAEILNTKLPHMLQLPSGLTFTRSSFIGGGNRRPRIWVTMGPSTPGTITVSPSLRRPLISITSMVVPIPGRALTYERHHHKGVRHRLQYPAESGLKAGQCPPRSCERTMSNKLRSWPLPPSPALSAPHTVPVSCST